MTIERRFELGQVLVRVVASEHGTILVEHLNALGLRVTHIDGNSGTGPVSVIFSVVRRKQLRQVVDLVHELNPEAFYSVEDVRDAAERPAPTAALSRPSVLLQPFYWFRKSK